MKVRLCLLTVLLLLASACGASSPPARNTALLTIIPPSVTSTQHSDSIDGEHVVFTPVDLDADPAQRVYVHLTESNTTPTAADPMWGVMANAGARVIVLAHDTIDSAESNAEPIPEILAALLRHLNSSAPTDGWNAFLTSEQDTSIEATLAWDKLIIAGHRDGAGRAAYFGARHETARVVLFSGPTEFESTARSHVIAFNHADDQLTDRESLWKSVGVPAQETRWSTAADLDQPASSITGNRFVSELEPIDGFNPRNDWQHRRYQSLWEYVCCE